LKEKLMNDAYVLCVNILVSGTELWPTPPNDDRIINTIIAKLPNSWNSDEWSVIDNCLVFVISKHDLDEETDEKEPYKLVVQMGIVSRDEFTSDSAESAARSVVKSWIMASKEKALPGACYAEWKHGNESIGSIKITR
tara:strand:+ start:4190 stop:4603 length:414 start_codon:yes stop_codon:yes gene_type:complete